jgi:hypothetical protein
MKFNAFLSYADWMIINIPNYAVWSEEGMWGQIWLVNG